ncbi:MAG: CehA/McbA family metallohydrolase [Candidatus Methanomethylicia archaeon]
MKVKLDLHVHTPYSDGNGSILEIIYEAYRRGMNGIAITDHYTTMGFEEAEKYAERFGLIVIPGVELRTDAGHIIALGVRWNLDYEAKLSYKEALKLIRGIGGVSIIAHPATHMRKSGEWLKNKPDAIEVLNSSYPFKFMINKSLNIAEKLMIPMTAGSDAHNPSCVGNAYTEIEVDDLNVEKILNALKSGRTRIFGKLSPLKNRMKIGIKLLGVIV